MDASDREWWQEQLDRQLREVKFQRKEKRRWRSRAMAAEAQLSIVLQTVTRMADGLPPVEDDFIQLPLPHVHAILQLGINTGLMYEAFVRSVRERVRRSINAAG